MTLVENPTTSYPEILKEFKLKLHNLITFAMLRATVARYGPYALP